MQSIDQKQGFQILSISEGKPLFWPKPDERLFA